MRRGQSLFACVVLCVAVLLGVTTAVAQVNTATLSGSVTDPQGLMVRGAKVTATSLATGAERTATTDEGGHYTIVGLVPGEYKIRVEGGTSFAPYEVPSFEVRVGQEAVLNMKLELGTQTQTVTVSSESLPIETTRSESAQTVEERQIDNLPINGRNYINFTLTNSQTTRDVSPTIGPAPNSGLNLSGARARSNMVSVDGADAGDNSVNGIRSTVSQEAVQEFQMILSNYNAEYGRATGGVVNIVTKSGGNDFHGDLFGYFRNKAFQARNAFSGEIDANGNLVPVKQAYTRTQSGLTLGGALKKDKTFYFFSYEYTQREETGFSSIGIGNYGLEGVNLPVPGVPGGVLPVQLTASQASAVNSLLTSGVPALQALGVNYGVLMGSASSVATNRLDYGVLAAGLTGGALNPGPGPQFPIPVACPASQTVNLMACAVFGEGVATLPASYVGLNSIRGNFPAMEKTSLWSARLDQRWNNHNTSFLRVGVSPSLSTGIQSTSQNQVFGQNAGSRTGVNQSRDFNVTFQHDTILSDSAFNEFRLQVARRGIHFGYSNLPGGSDIGVNIPGYGYFGREPYSTVDRIERRFEFTDSATLTRGRHTFKFGADVNVIQLRSKKQQIFQLDFGGDVNFGAVAADSLGFPDCVNPASGSSHTGACAQGELALNLPSATGLQAYGLGIPTTYIQGIGTSNQPFDNLPFGFFGQDTWRLTRNLTLNYGLRYDFEISPLFSPATAVNAAAEKSLGIIEGIPRDYKNVAPRIGIAWDPRGDSKTVVRAGYGLFYDHPLLAVAFDSVTADGGRSVQLLSAGGTPSACGLLTLPSVCGGGADGPQNLNGSSIFQGVLNALPNMFYLPNQQRFDPYQTGSLFANQNYLTAGFPLPILPFTLPVKKDFQYGYAQQANLTIEHVIVGNWKLSAGYQWTRGLHLNRPQDINSTDPQLLTNNLLYADAAGLGFTNPVLVQVQDKAPVLGVTCGLTTAAPGLVPGILGVLYGCPSSSLNGKFVGTPAFFNFFRPSGPNPSFATATALSAPQCQGAPTSALLSCGFAVQQALAGAAGFPVGVPGVPIPFNSVDAQVSNGNSWYSALTINLEKRFSKHFELLSSYTWSHSMDDSTDLQSTLEPQDSRFPGLERSNSVNDQRHRWVTSAVFQSSPHKSGETFWNSFLSNFTLSPLVEWASGRPYNVITGLDTRLDLGGSQDRPSVVAPGAPGATTSPFIHGVAFGEASTCLQANGSTFTVPGITPPYGCIGSLGRNAFTMPGFFQFDMRVSKGISFGERFRLDLIADGFNLFNHTNVLAVNQLCDPSAGAVCTAGQPSAAYDARQFQFALKLNW
ncbi:MAG: TonB-dependent receptor domain-containing protein [Candidatus Acidiferrales bacterium]